MVYNSYFFSFVVVEHKYFISLSIQLMNGKYVCHNLQCSTERTAFRHEQMILCCLFFFKLQNQCNRVFACEHGVFAWEHRVNNYMCCNITILICKDFMLIKQHP